VVDDPYRITTVILWKSARLKLLIEALKTAWPLVAVLQLLRFCRLLLALSTQAKKQTPPKLKLAGRHANSGPIYQDISKEQVGGDIEAVGQPPYVLDCQIAFTMKDFGNDAGGTKYIR
jgi:hypothetical protein